MPTYEDRFWDKVIQTDDGCWHWNASHSIDGYARFGSEGAHRVVYRLCVGPIPDDMVIDHLCRNRGCVNPDHLEVVTWYENTIARRVHAQSKKTECPQGHPYDEDNTYINGGRRHCRACHRDRERIRRSKVG